MARENAIESVREMYASRVESLRKKKILLPLPPILFGDRVIAPLYSRRSKEEGDKARFSVEVYQDLPTFQKILAINQLLATDPDNIGRLTRFLQTKVLTEVTTRGIAPASNIREVLAEAGLQLLGQSTTLRIPYPTDGIEVNPEMIVRVLEEFKMSAKTDLAKKRAASNAYTKTFERIIVGEDLPESERSAFLGDVTLDNNTAVPQSTVLSGEPTRAGILEIVPPAEDTLPPLMLDLKGMSKKELVALALSRGLNEKGTKADIIARIEQAQ
jgi:hypothetical protein